MPPLADAELMHAIRDQEIKIDGKQGIDWDFAQPNSGSITGVNVVIEPQRTWIPEGKKPVQISDTNRDFRQEVDTWHRLIEQKPIPDPDQKILWVGETPKITLSENYEGVLNHIVLPTLETTKSWTTWGTHINSHLIDSKSDWKIRVEVLSPTRKEAMPNFVTFYFYRNKEKNS